MNQDSGQEIADSQHEVLEGERGGPYLTFAKLIDQMHLAVEYKEMQRISRIDMAKRLGLSERAYVEYQRNTTPLAALAILRLLAQLGDDQIVRFVREWEKHGPPPVVKPKQVRGKKQEAAAVDE